MSNFNNPFAYIKLSRATTVCFDKGKALCDGELSVKKLVILDPKNPESQVSQIISNVLNATNEQTPIAKALKQKYDFELSTDIKETIPYNHEAHSFGATFKNGKTYIIGLPEHLPIKNKTGILNRCEEFVNRGHDVYVLGMGTIEIEVIALIVAKENIRESMTSSIKWLNDNGVDVKVLSNDSAIKSAALAYDAGVKNTNRQVSLENMALNNVKANSDSYVVFGDASEEQKVAVIDGLKSKGKNVILIDSECGNLPKALIDSKIFTNNLHRAGLFLLTKVLLAIALVVLFAVGYKNKAFNNPFILGLIVDIFVTVLLLLSKRLNEIKGKFIINALKYSLPGAVMTFINALVVFILYTLQQNGAVSFGVYNAETAMAMTAIVFAISSIAVLYEVLSPLNKYRRTLLVATGFVTAAVLVVSAIISYSIKGADPVFGIAFNEMNGPTYLISIIITIVSIGLYTALYKIFGKDEEYEN